MSTIFTADTFASAVSNTKEIEKTAKETHNHPICLSCNKKTLKFIEEKWCFQCYFIKLNKHRNIMSDPLKCPKPDCMVKVKLVNNSRENDFCKFQEAECPQCNQLYWLVKYDNKRTLRIREEDDDVEFFDQYFAALSAA